MPMYRVLIPEVFMSVREVRAPSEEEAKILASEDLDTEISCEYAYTIENDKWSVEAIVPKSNKKL